MDETKKANEGKAKEQTSLGKDGTTSTVTPKTYTEEAYKKAISDALAKQGRENKVAVETIIKERDTLKGQIRSKEDLLSDITTEREELKKQIDDLSKDDPEKFNIIKKDRELRERENQLKTKLRDLEARETTHGERIKKAEGLEREILIQEIVDEYEGGNFDKLKDLCETLEVTGEDKIRVTADTLWTKKPETPVEPPVKPFSSMTDGGGQLTEEGRLKQRYPSMFPK